MKSMVLPSRTAPSQGAIPPPADTGLPERLAVIEETASVQVVPVDQGGWRIHKKVSFTEQRLDEELQDYTVQVERRPIGRTLEGSEAPPPRYEGSTLVLSVVEEVLVTEKRLVLVEEVRVTGVHGSHRTQQQVQLRKETVSVERLAPEDPFSPAPPGQSPQGHTGQRGASPHRPQPPGSQGSAGLPPHRGTKEQHMSSVIVGIFDTQEAANHAKNELLVSGFANHTVVLSDEDVATMHSGTVAGATAVQPQHRQAPEEEEGAIARFFRSIFGDSEDHNDPYGSTYREAIRRGHYGVSVSVDSEADLDRAEAVLTRCGAVDIDERSAQWRGEGWVAGGAAIGTQPLAADGGATALDRSVADRGMVTGGDAGTLQELSEELRVGKRSVARGGVRVFSQMVETPVQETVSLRQEHVDVQRRAVDRPATEADFAAFKEGSMEVREMSEEAVVSKEARVVGEVDIGKTVTEHDETVRDTVRETRVQVEQLDPQALPAGRTGLSPDSDPGLPRP